MVLVPPEGPTPVLSSPGSVIRSAMIDMIDIRGSSSFRSSDSDTSSVDASRRTSTSTNFRRLPSVGPIIVGILAVIIVIVTIVVIYIVKHRTKRLRRRRRTLEAQISLQPDLHPRQHSRNRFSGDEMSLENDPPQQKYHPQSRHSRNSSGTMELNIRNSIPQIMVPGDGSRSMVHKTLLPLGDRELQSANASTNSTFSSTLYTNKIGVNKPNHQAVDGRQTLVSESPLQPPSETELLNPLQHSNIRNSSALPPEVRQQHLNALIQKRAPLLASGSASDKSVYNERLLLDEQIENLRRQDGSPSNQDDPPPYDGCR